MTLTLEQVAITQEFKVSRTSEFEDLLIIERTGINRFDFDVFSKEPFDRLREEYQGKDMIFDMSDISYVDFSGSRLLIDALKQKNSGGSYFDVCNVQGDPNVRSFRNPARAFMITGLNRLFEGYQNSLEQAIEAYRTHTQSIARIE